MCRGRVELTGASSRAEGGGEGWGGWAVATPIGRAFHARGCLVPWLRQHTVSVVSEGAGEAR